MMTPLSGQSTEKRLGDDVPSALEQPSIRSPEASVLRLVNVPRESLDVLRQALPIVQACVTGYYTLIQLIPGMSEVKLRLHGGTGKHRNATTNPNYWYRVIEELEKLQPQVSVLSEQLVADAASATSAARIGGLVDEALEQLRQLWRDGADPTTEPAKEPLRKIDDAESAARALANECRAKATKHLGLLQTEATRLSDTMRAADTTSTSNSRGDAGPAASVTLPTARDPIQGRGDVTSHT
jgi:hypothetical protein